MPKVVISESAWPILQAHWPADVDVETIESHFDDMEHYLERNERHAVLVNLTKVTNQTAELRRVAEQRLRALAERVPELVAGIAFVVGSSLSWAIITAVHWRAPLPVPMRAFVTRPQAKAWLESILAGKPPPANAGREVPRPPRR